jgi:prepilin-type N-terminal cleavage/methylation domain-containing protein
MTVKKAFTLIELFVALSVLLLAAGVIGWNVKGAMDRHRFLASVDQFAIQLRELQVLALSYQSDMEVEFSRKGEMISYRRKSDEPLTILDRGRVSLDGVSEVLFNGKKKDTFKLNVLSTGRIEPSGILHFKQKEENLWVDFSTPLLVKIRNTPPYPLGQ